MMVTIDESRTACKYTSGRQGRRVDKIVIHHWGLDGQTHDGVVDWFCNPARGAQTSAHFVVSGGRVHCIVSPADTAWHAGDWDANLTSIGIECRPEATAADYATVAWLVRWLRAQYGNLPLRPHKAFFGTACPGRWDLARLDREAGATTTGGGSAVSGAMRPAPEMYPITQRYRQNATSFNSSGMHGALDYGVPVGTPLVAAEDAIVLFDGWAWGLPGGPNDWHLRWYLIKPARGDTKGGGGILTIFQGLRTGRVWGYAHASKSIYNKGDRINVGQIIQISGATGIITGPHSHVNLWPATPNWTNGAYGAIDPEPVINRPYAPTTSTSWQGSATTGTGGATTKNKDIIQELLMATPQEVDKLFNDYFNRNKGRAGTLAWAVSNSNDRGRNIEAAVKRVEKLAGAIVNAVKPSTLGLAVWAYKNAKVNGTKDTYQLLTDARNNTTPAAGSTTTKGA